MPAQVLVVGVAEKAAADRIRIPCDFGNEPKIINGARITSYTVTTAGTGAPTASSPLKDYYYQISAIIAGGTAGGTYTIIYTITLDDADATVISRTGLIKVY